MDRHGGTLSKEGEMLLSSYSVPVRGSLLTTEIRQTIDLSTTIDDIAAEEGAG
jgi:hypothetical protein